MKQPSGAANRASSQAVRPLICAHHFHVVHVAGRVIPGVLVCESCGQRMVYRRKKATTAN
jgi:hypothetical protein